MAFALNRILVSFLAMYYYMFTRATAGLFFFFLLILRRAPEGMVNLNLLVYSGLYL